MSKTNFYSYFYHKFFRVLEDFDFKAFRKRKEMTQKEAAEYFGCDQSFISQIETGKSEIPRSFMSKIRADGGVVNHGTMGNIGVVGQVHGDFHNDTGKDKVIETQEQQIFRMFEAFMEELRGFHGYIQRQDDYIKRQDDHLDSIVKKSYLRNERNMERMDGMIDQQNTLIGQQNELIKIIDRQNQKVQERADRLLDLLEKKL